MVCIFVTILLPCGIFTGRKIYCHIIYSSKKYKTLHYMVALPSGSIKQRQHFWYSSAKLETWGYKQFLKISHFADAIHFVYSFFVLVFSLVGKTIDISYILARNLKHNTVWYCCHKVVSSGNNTFDISWQNLKYALW